MSNSINPILASPTSMVVPFANRVPIYRENTLMNASERHSESEISLIEMAKDLRFKETDDTDTKIVKASTIIGGSIGAIGVGIPTGVIGAFLGGSAGAVIGFSTGHLIIKVKKSSQCS